MSATLHLIARIAGQRVAMPTAAIDSVVEPASVVPVPRAPAHVAGLAALRSRVLTLIDCEAALGLPPAGTAGRKTVVLAADGHLYGLLVDAVEDVVDLVSPVQPVSTRLAGGWAAVAVGLVDHGGDALLLIDPAALLSGPAIATAA